MLPYTKMVKAREVHTITPSSTNNITYIVRVAKGHHECQVFFCICPHWVLSSELRKLVFGHILVMVQHIGNDPTDDSIFTQDVGLAEQQGGKATRRKFMEFYFNVRATVYMLCANALIPVW
jgi:hypothetical protein